MNLEAYDVDSLRKVVRELQDENEELREQLHRQNVPAAESRAFFARRDEDLYDPDQGARIEHLFITREMLSFFYKMFQGRPDVYARRGRNGGYYPQCVKRWSQECPFQNGRSRYCLKNQCTVREWLPLTGRVLLDHLLGKSKFGDDAIGVYPLFHDGTCHFLVFDFDNHEKSTEYKDDAKTVNQWKDEVDALRMMCRNNNIDCLVERSRSGRGAHVWIFFAGKVKASVARAFGYGLLKKGAESINLISFEYYDRMYPSQDCSDSIGNLIALPLQGQALKEGNSAFVDENWNAYSDQWAQLKQRHRYAESELIAILTRWRTEGGTLASSDRYAVVNIGPERLHPWENDGRFRKCDITGPLHIVLADGIYIDALNLKPGIQNQIRSLASFSNPVFQENKAMGHSNYATVRILYLGQDTDGYIRIPRGLLERIESKCRESGIIVDIQNKRSVGKPIRVTFRQELYMQQELAAQRLLQHDDGILSAATAFGKTAVCSYLIASRKVSTLILLRSKDLMHQWMEEFDKFLQIEEEPPEYVTPKGRVKRRSSAIGTFEAGKNKLTGIIDLAMIDSLCRREDLADLLKTYGMVIMDECHHGASAGAQKVLMAVSSKYVYGVSATPFRGDHLERINYMLLGPIRMTYTARERAETQGIDHLIRPRFTRIADSLGTAAHINDYYELLQNSQVRNKQIVADIRQCILRHRTVAVLTRFKSHARELSEQLSGTADHVFLLYGDNTDQENTEIERKMPLIPDGESVLLIATGQKIGEGFNFPRLDTLILAMPISRPGVVEQYVGRLNRDYPGKKNVIVYDYVDSHIRFFDRMYQKRLRTYKKIGYRIISDLDFGGTGQCGDGHQGICNQTDGPDDEYVNAIYDSGNYIETFERDLLEARKSIVIASPQLDQGKIDRFVKVVTPKIEDGVKVCVITQNSEVITYDNEDHLLYMADEMKKAGVDVVMTEEYGNHYAVIDDQLVWHGGMNLLGKEDVWDNLMRTIDPDAAQELLFMAQNARKNTLN